jgi:hypothetical protein
MKVEYPDYEVTLDFVVPTVENVGEAIEGGAVRIDGEDPAELLARLEANAKAGPSTADDKLFEALFGDLPFGPRPEDAGRR